MSDSLHRALVAAADCVCEHVCGGDGVSLKAGSALIAFDQPVKFN